MCLNEVVSLNSTLHNETNFKTYFRRDQDISEEEERFEDFGEADELSETDSHGTPNNHGHSKLNG